MLKVIEFWQIITIFAMTNLINDVINRGRWRKSWYSLLYISYVCQYSVNIRKSHCSHIWVWMMGCLIIPLWILYRTTRGWFGLPPREVLRNLIATMSKRIIIFLKIRKVLAAISSILFIRTVRGDYGCVPIKVYRSIISEQIISRISFTDTVPSIVL